MKRRKPTPSPTDPALARYDQESAFPTKVAQAKAQLATTNLAKLGELLAQSLQAPA